MQYELSISFNPISKANNLIHMKRFITIEHNSYLKISSHRSNKIKIKMAIEDNIEEFGNNIPKILFNNPLGINTSNSFY